MPQVSIPTFTSLSPSTSIYIPSKVSSKPRSSTITLAPHLILLCTYLNASPTHITKYVLGYKRLFPTSRILLVTTSSSNFLFQSSAQWSTELDPAVTELLAIQRGETVLLHAISTGGATAAVKIAEAYSARSSGLMPVTKMVLDSCPGTAGYTSTVGAFSVGLLDGSGLESKGSWWWSLWGRARALVLGAGLRVFFAIWFLCERLVGLENVVRVVRKRVNDTTLFSPGATRMYIYSGRDELVHAQDVEEHAEKAEKGGYEVLKVRYLESAHAGHLLQDEGRFWGNVVRLWDSGFLSGPGMIVCAW